MTIGNSVTSIGGLAFYYCTSLMSVTIGNSVTSIGGLAFSSCTSLTSVTIPDSVTSIGQAAFYRCTSLASVTIGNSVTSIGGWVFFCCYSMTSVTIPDSVTSIGENAFYRCTSLADVYYNGTQSQWSQISIGVDNAPLSSIATTIHFNSSGPDTPDDSNRDTPASDGTTISFSQDNYECVIGEEIPLSGELYSPNGTAGISIEWSTTDENSVSISTPGSVANTDANHLIFSALATGKKEGQFTVMVITSNGASSTRNITVKSISNPDDQEDIHAVSFDPESTSGIYQVNGTLEDYVTTVILNGSAYVESVTINGKDYNVKKDVLTHERAQDLRGKDVICDYNSSTKEIIAISKCREFSNLNQTDIETIKRDRRISVSIKNGYNWYLGKVHETGSRREVEVIPFRIMVYNAIPSAYFDLTDSCKNNTVFDYQISSITLSGIENCGDVHLFDSVFPKTVKLGRQLLLEGEIIIPPDFWLGYEDSEKSIVAEYDIKMESGESIKSTFQTVVINRDQRITPPNENNLLTNAASQLKNSTAISLIGLKSDLGFTNEQIKYLEKLVLVELSLYTMPKESLNEYVSKRVIEKIFNANSLVGVQNGKLTIVVSTYYQNRQIQVDIVCDIQGYSLYNCTFGNFANLTYHAYNLKNNGKRENVAFKDGVAGLSVSADVDAFANTATDLALSQIKSATKTALNGYEEVERIIFGETALKILSAAGYDSVFDLGWKLYVNQCKELAYRCPVDVYVYDKDNALCGAIVNNEVTLDTSDDVDLCVKNDEKIVTLWDDNYYVKTLSNCTGTMNISVREMGYVNGDIRVLNFEDVPLEIGTIYTQHCGNGYYDDSESYAVESLNGDTIEASTDSLEIQALLKFTVNYNPSGGIITETSKTVYESEYIILPTATRVGYSLLGWSTIGDDAAIFEAESSYKVTADTSLVAVWENNPISKPSVQSVSVSDITLNYKADTTIQPQITADDGVKYTVKYESSNSAITTVDENGKVYAAKKGRADITVTVTDEFGNIVSDTCKVTIKYTWWQILIRIFLFGWIWY